MTDMTVPQFVDSLDAPDWYVDGYSGFLIHHNNVRITFESVKANHDTPPKTASRVVVGRLVMPVGIAEMLAKELLSFVEKQRNQPAPPVQAQGTPTLQ